MKQNEQKPNRRQAVSAALAAAAGLVVAPAGRASMNGTPVAPVDNPATGASVAYHAYHPDDELTPAQCMMYEEERAILIVKFRQLEAALKAVADDQEDNEDGDEGFDEDVYHILRHVNSAAELLSSESGFDFEKAALAEVKRLRQEFADGKTYHGCPVFWTIKSFEQAKAAADACLGRHTGDGSELLADCCDWQWDLQLFKDIFESKAMGFMKKAAEIPWILETEDKLPESTRSTEFNAALDTLRTHAGRMA